MMDMRATIRTLLHLVVLLALVPLGCGDPEDVRGFSHVRFTVEPDRGAGVAQFQVAALQAGAVHHTSLCHRTFTTTGPFSFFLLNAAPPYAGVFRQIGGTGIRVTMRVEGQSEVVRFSSGAVPAFLHAQTEDDVADLLSPDTLQCAAEDMPAAELRFEVCSPINDIDCLVEQDGEMDENEEASNDDPAVAASRHGAFGVEYQGAIGDADVSYLLSTTGGPLTTPSIHFLNGAHDIVNAVIRSVEGQALHVRFYRNAQPAQVKTGTQDIVIREDL